jgi:hypothetical protein
MPQARDILSRILLPRPQRSRSLRARQSPHQHHPYTRNRLPPVSSSRACAGQTSVGHTIGARSSTTLRVRYSRLVSRSARSVLKWYATSIGTTYSEAQMQNHLMAGEMMAPTGRLGRRHMVSAQASLLCPHHPHIWISLKLCTCRI